ncbi:glycosyltransferase [Lapillicoccus jejuensis]|uniref:4,4'-diaponeurosporenoate glycosyltransferase n=1 Tax=Lapillicoccus jejuensis TaxID=402171 RepID=A0A542E1F2_9MICO|nr:glycosyltransferase family 2 protein [Lapillicoccus jejuensis]TQJ09173.1 glycosyl transferase family 2 [Lapillicoccus jejuensis]
MTISVVVPAYNEGAVLGRLLDALAGPDGGAGLQVVVVCNGCSDDTEEVARRHPIAAVVVSTPVGSKHGALVLGDQRAQGFPRFYVDADVVVTGDGVRRLAEQLHGGRHAVAPGRDLRTERSAWVVRAYYAVWQHLPSVRDGLVGRGVLGVDEEGFARITPRPDVLGDDLVVDLAFAPQEKVVDDSVRARIEAPRTVGDLVRRRVRAQQGNRQVDRGPTGASPRTGTGLSDVTRTVRRRAASPAQAAVFLAVTLVGRTLAARRSMAAGWLRDESSRAA